MNASLFDDDLDTRLNDVPLPASLLARLRTLPLVIDADLDEVLADVAVPASLNRRLFRTPRLVPARRLSRWLEQAAAAVLIFAIGVAYTFAAVAFVTPRFEQRAWGDDARLPLISGMERLEPVIQQASSDEMPDDLDTPFVELALPLADEREWIRRVGAGQLSQAEPYGEAVAMAASRGQPMFRSAEMSFDVLNSRLIEREAVKLAHPDAMDLVFWRRTGLLPWLETVSNQSIAVPLLCDDASYRLAREEIRAGRLPAAGNVRIEEFLAGIDYGPATRQTADASLRVMAGPSPFAVPLDDLIAGRGVPTHWLVMIVAALPDVAGQEPAPPQLAADFSTQHVVKYRILGYCPPNSGGGRSDVGDANDEQGDRTPLSGKTTVVLCEIELKGSVDLQAELARVRLDGVPAYGSSDTSRSITAVLQSAMFSRDFNTAPLVWRQAALVALAAELLAGSPFAESASLADVAALARQMEPSVNDRTGWHDFIETVSRAQSLRSSLLRAF